MTALKGFPHDMVNHLESKFGQFVGLEALKGVVSAASSTCKLQFLQGSAVVKSSFRPRERLFYERYANTLRKHGVPLAELYWSGTDTCQKNWIALEDIPNVFPQDQWRNNPIQIQVLYNLHSYTRDPSQSRSFNDEDIWYRPKWDENLTHRACSWYAGTAQMAEVKNLLFNVQEHSQVLFKPDSWLSGDPNPTNWRIRTHGELVLLDWERFCRGNPAIDLAITMPTLDTKDLSWETNIAKHYKGFEGKHDILPSSTDLAFQIRLAKIWTMVEFIANAVQDEEHYSKETIVSILEKLPNFLRSLL